MTISRRHPSAWVALFLAIGLSQFVVPVEASPLRIPVDPRAVDLRPVDQDGVQTWAWEGATWLRQEGKVLLPTQRFEVALEADEQIVSVRLEGGRRVEVAAAGNLAVLPPMLSDEGKAARSIAFEPDPTARSYPPVSGRLVADQFQHGFHIAGVEAYPLYVEDGRLWMLEGAELVIETGPRTDDRQVVRRERRLPDWRERVLTGLRARVVNPRVLDDAPMAMESSVLVGGDAPDARRAPSLGTSPVRHLIVTTDALAPEFQRLAEHRTAMGLPSLVVTLTDILANYRQGLDLAETLREYLRDAYAKWGVDYLLIGGDTEIVPTRHVYSTFYPANSFTNVPCDLYFGALDGNWNADGDGFIGEPFRNAVDVGDFVDFQEEIAVGRATVATPLEARQFVDKVLDYEIPQNLDHQTRSLIAAEVLFPSDWNSPGDPLQLDGAELAEALIDSSFAACGPPTWTLDRYYQNHTAWPGAVPESPASVTAGLSSGAYGLFHHIGHGFYFNMSVGSGSIVPSHADALNNGPNYFILYSMNCSSAAFDFNCLNERFLRNPTGGAVVAIGSARAAFPSTAGPVQEEFYKAWFCEESMRVGDIVAASRAPFLANTFYNTVERWTLFVYTLLGDPASPVWNDAPNPVTILAPPSHSMDGAGLLLTVTSPDSQVVKPGVLVTARKGDETFAMGTTDPSGQVVLDVVPETLGEIEIWVSGQNVVPATTQVAVLDPSEGAVRVAALAFSDDSAGASAGNGNGLVEGGETVEILPLLRNGSATAFAGGTAVVTTTDPWLTVLDDVATVSTIGGQSTLMAVDPWVVLVAPDVPDAHEVTLQIVISPGPGGSTVDEERFLIAAPEIEVVEIVLDDSVSGDGDGLVSVGEAIELSVFVKNFGSGSAQGLEGTLALASGLGSVVVPATSWPDAPDVLDVVESDPQSRLTVTANDPTLSNVLFDLTITDGAGRVLTHRFDLDVPVAPENLALADGGPGTLTVRWAPSVSPDVVGYRVYRKDPGSPEFELSSEDVVLGSAIYRDIDLTPLSVYEFAVAAVDAGGVSSALSLPFSATTYPPEIACFPLAIGLETSGALAVGPVDHDWIEDIVVGADYVYVLDANCNEKVDGDGDSQTIGPAYPVPGRYNPAGIALGDLDRNNTAMEIVATDRDTKRLFVFDDRGNVLPGWPRTLLNWAWGTPVVADLDGDEDLEVVINDLSGFTYAFHHDGTEVADGDANPSTYGPIAPRRVQDVGGTLYYESFGRTTPAVFDVDGDGSAEILFGSKYQNINAPDYFYALKTDGSGANAAGWPKTFAPRSEFLAAPTVADLENDGVHEIIAVCENDSIYVWDQFGARRPGFPIRRQMDGVNMDSLTPSPAVGDFDEDGTLEIVIVSVQRWTSTDRRSYLEIVGADGSSWPGWPVYVDDISESSPTVADLDGDGSLDILYGVGGTDVSDFLYAFDKDGSDLAGFPIPVEGFVRATPTITDLDGDGSVNVVLASWDRLLHAWDLLAPYDEARTPWPTFRGNVNRTGVYRQVVRTPAPAVPTITEARLHPAMPNPFNPATELRFELPGASEAVSLAIFDAQGRRVRVLHSGSLGAGEHRFLWDGTDLHGEGVASGIYYARLSTEGRIRGTRKLALVK